MRRALVVGIDHYPEPYELHGCINDANSVSDMLKVHNDGSPNWNVQLRTSAEHGPTITRDSLLGDMAQLFENPREHDLLFYFSGHGAQTDAGTELVTQDMQLHSFGVSVDQLLNYANESPARSVTIILDCCYSGDAGAPPGLQATGVARSFRIDKSLLRENVTVLAASLANESAVEANGHGMFTRLLLEGLAGGATNHVGNINALGLYSFISPAFDPWYQRPILKTSMTEPLCLRVGPPWIDPAMLRDLTKHFETEFSHITLTADHEGEGRPLPTGTSGTVQQQQFDYLGRLRNANLATSDDHKAFYWLTVHGGDVYLTPLGRYFWRLVHDRRL